MPGDSVALSYRLFGEDVSASKALKGVGDTAETTGRRIGEGIGEGSSHLETLGDHADTSEQRIMGLKDSVDGLSTIMQGPGEQGVAAYLQGWADLSSGIANFVVPALMKVIPATVKNAVATAWATTTQTAASAASKAWAAAQWLLNAALSANPIALVVLAIVALIGIFVLAYNKVGWFRDLVNAAWSGIKTAIGGVVSWFQNTAWPIIQKVIGFVVAYYKLLWTTFSSVVGWIIAKGGALIGWFTGLPGKVGEAVSGLWDGIKTAFRSALNWIIDAWNNFRLQFPSFDFDWNGPLPGGQVTVGGWTVDTPNLPRLASGGIVRRRPGGILANIGEGRFDEAVVPLDGRGLGGTHYHLHLDGVVLGGNRATVGRDLLGMIEGAIRNNTARPALLATRP